ncbi:MAG: response regulator [Nitrospirae bacterium]|nr:response regulator [Nitrospirota bacterium]
MVKIFEAESPEKLISTNAISRYKNLKDRGVLIENLKSKNQIDHFELEMVTMSGKPVNVLISAKLENDIISGMVMDITEHKKLEAKLIHAQKMETVGTLAGGVAHDFNNILTAIIGYGNLLKMKMKNDDPLLHFTEQILSSSERAANLVRNLLAFSRKQITNPRPLNINEIVNRVENLLRRIIGEDIELKITLTDEDLTVIVDSGQIEQVLMNLATNARDAMPNGGTLTICTELTKPDEEFITVNNHEKAWRYALISVSDTGIGMDKDTKDKIFEPFFTTKEVGKGTGLGLSIVYGIVQQHDGFIDYYSELGKGTTFKIYLPVIKLKDTVQTKSAEITEVKGGTETILLAEDEEKVRTIAKTVLEEAGYKVIEALDGEDAINKFIENKDKVQFLLFDIIMPKMSGRTAFEKIKEIRPDIKVLFVSGYSADFIHEKEILEQGLNFMSKPITPTALLTRVREVLDD